ncbi:MAG: SOS response-associated peptidase family protein [Roseobacter sp.]|uniref:SOS response-associated peptidase family protein n=1 Tax=Sphingomonadales TaxID=204457 RepID=UPI0032670F3D
MAKPSRFTVSNADGRPMILARLWADIGFLETTTYSIITTAATKAFEPIHNRLPAILEREQVST